MKRSKASFDYLILLVYLFLMGIGLLMVLSATPAISLKMGDLFYYLKRQGFYVLLSLLALFVGLKIDYRIFKKLAKPFFLGAIFMLCLLFLPGVGVTAGGATRWIYLGPLSFQPSELMKLALIFFLADLMVKKGPLIKDFKRGLLPLLLTILMPALIIFLEPDLGTAIMLTGIGFVMLYTAGMRFSHLLVLIVLGAQGVLVLSVMSPYRLKRLMAFINPWKDPLGIGFNIIQALLAVGSGGLWGLGFGKSLQKFSYLPGQYTDFIFAILAEEFGFLGALGVILLYVIFTIRGIRVALKTKDLFARVVAVGIVFWISGQAILNLGVVLALLPTTGIPLPFISFGGTSLLILSFAVGILLNISRGSKAYVN